MRKAFAYLRVSTEGQVDKDGFIRQKAITLACEIIGIDFSEFHMRVFPQELFICRLKGELSQGRQYDWARSKSIEEYVEGLRKLSGLDLGVDAVAGDKWWQAAHHTRSQRCNVLERFR